MFRTGISSQEDVSINAKYTRTFVKKGGNEYMYCGDSCLRECMDVYL